MSTHESPVFREGNIAFENSGTHSRSRIFGSLRFLGELERAAAAVPDTETVDGDGLVLAGLKFGF